MQRMEKVHLTGISYASFFVLIKAHAAILICISSPSFAMSDKPQKLAAPVNAVAGVLGACCGGAGGPTFCDDTPDGGIPGEGIDEVDCFLRTNGLGIFISGVRCADDPCIVCTLQNSIHCQESFDTIAIEADRHHALRSADDFKPIASDISRICWSGVWAGTAAGVNCNDDPPDDNWYLTIYEDDGNGLPDPSSILVGPELPFTHDARIIVNNQPDFKPTQYSAPLNVTGLTPGNCYWLEILGEGSGDLNSNEACTWNWMRTDTSGVNQGDASKSQDGNSWSAFVPAGHPTQYTESSLLSFDLAWCADSGIQKNTVGNEGVDGGCGNRVGSFACCYRDNMGNPICTNNVSLFECILGPADQGLSGTVFSGETCLDAGGTFICTPPVNDDCDTSTVIVSQSCVAVNDIGNCANNKSRWCYRPSICSGGDGDCILISDANGVISDNQFDCAIQGTDNRFATTDGPSAMINPSVTDDCSSSDNGGGPFHADVWWKVDAPCGGLMNVSMCGGDVYDAMMAAYTQCPDGNDNSAPDLIECNDNACGSISTVSKLPSFPVSIDQELFIRIGGRSPNGPTTPGTAGEASQGLSQFHVRFACIPPAVNPVMILTGEPGLSKDRYVSFDPTTNGVQAVAIRVTRVSSKTDLYVDCTSLQNKGADGWYASLIDGPLPAPGNPFYYCDFSNVTTGLHVNGCSVVPGNTYEVSMAVDGITFTTTVEIATTTPQFDADRQFGDTVGGLLAGVWTAPDGLVTANDIVATVLKFSLRPAAPIVARVDTDGFPPNTIINGGDILRAVSGFAGEDFGFGVICCLEGKCVPDCANEPIGACCHGNGTVSGGTLTTCDGVNDTFQGDGTRCINFKPMIATQPQDATAPAGLFAIFSIVATSSSGTLHYQWKKSGINVGNDSPMLTLQNVTLDDDGDSIICKLMDDCGNTISNPAILTVTE